MLTDFTTPRLHLQELQPEDADFIIALVNTPEWITFIGNRNITSPDEALAYIHKIKSCPEYTYWVVRLSHTTVPIGIITFIQREYLPHPDIGFAFLPRYVGQGYAFEAAQVVLDALLKEVRYFQILATTVKENWKSIRLLEKLGMLWIEEISPENELLQVYGITNECLPE
jgi:ribosomal-protein-alanine N-acetyltransferase